MGFRTIGQRTRQLGRRTGVVAAIVAVLASYSVVGPVSSAYAASLAGSAFEIDVDANLTVEGSGIDWLSGTSMRSGVTLRHDTASGSSDNSFTTGTHEDSAVPDVETGSIPPNKSDLLDFGLYVERPADKVFLNVFWTRVQDPSGTTNMDFEFNQSAVKHNDPASGPQIIPVRTVGDLLLTYDLVNGGTVASISKRFWGGSSWGPASALGATQALGSINSTAIAAGSSGGLGALSPRTFGEASVDLAVLLPADEGCRTYGSVYLKSRSSASFSSALKDFIAPQAVDLSNCGAVKVHKTDANGPLAGAGFTLYKDVAPIGGSKGAGDTVSAGSCTTAATGDCTITDVKKGDYWLVETTVPAGHDGVADQHVTITTGDQVVTFNLVDPIQTGTITVTKNAVPDDAQDFTFTLDAQGFSLDDDADGTLPRTRSFTVPVGSHTVTETDVPTGWALTGLTCTDPSGGTTVASPTASIALAKDETVACTYTNAFTQRDVNLQTQTVSAGAGSWNDTATLTGDGTHAVTGSVAFFACGANATATACTTGGTAVGTAVAVSHTSGATYGATTNQAWTPSGAGWTCFRAEFTSTSGFYASSSHTNATSECFLKQAANLTVSKTAAAAYGRLYSWTVEKSVDDSSVSIPAGATATSSYRVSVGNTHVDDAWTVTGTITVTNPNPVAFTGVTVTDSIDNGAGSCSVTGGTAATVPANGQLLLAYTCTYSSAPSPSVGTNTATATWSAATFLTPAGSASATAGVDFSKITPSVTDEIVTVTDTVQGVLGTLDARTAANPTVLTYTVDRSGVAGACTAYPNTASVTANDSEATGTSSASVTVCVGSDLVAGVNGAGSRDRDDLWSIAKRVDRTRVDMPQGATATFTYQVEVTPAGSVDSNHALAGLASVTNPNDWEAITATVTVAADVGGGVSCTVTGGTGVSVPASGSVSLPYSCAFSGQPATSGQVTATVTWNAGSAFTPTGIDTSSTGVSFAIASETHSTITVVDDKTDPAHPVTLGTASHGTGSTVFTYSISTQGVAGTCTDYTNTAVIAQTQQSASRVVELCVGQGLTLSATGAGSYDRDYLWTIDKAVDRTTVTVDSGSSAAFVYTVTATPGGVSDSGYALDGTVTVTNPNDWEDLLADVTVTTDVAADAVCTVVDGVDRTVPKGGSLVLAFGCAFTTAPALTGAVTATSTWDQGRASTPVATADVSTPVELVLDSESHATVTVSDDRTDPANPVTLGTATWADGPSEFTYTLSKTAVGGSCSTYTNVATLVETEQSDSQAVEVCGFTGGGGTVVPPPTGGGGGLVLTGDMTGLLTRWALVLLAAGALLVAIGRRREV